VLVEDLKLIAGAIKRADIPHELHVLDEMPHAFMQMNVLRGCQKGLGLMFDFLRRLMK
jgi:hypothetical protein